MKWRERLVARGKNGEWPDQGDETIDGFTSGVHLREHARDAVGRGEIKQGAQQGMEVAGLRHGH
jgi:hypothetical protein